MAGVSIQEQINAAYAPIRKRSDGYGQAITSLRNLFLAYFCNPKVDYSLLTEPAKANEEPFNHEQVKEGLEACLIDLKVFLQEEPKIRAQFNTSSLCLRKTLDHFVWKSPLGLGFNETLDYYCLAQDRLYTPKAQIFMEQFTVALNFFRLCCAIGELYYEFDRDYQQVNESLAPYFAFLEKAYACLEKASALKEEEPVGDKDAFLSAWKEVKELKQGIKKLLKKANEWPPSFAQYEERIKKLNEILEAGAQQLQLNYSHFDSDTRLWLFKDGSWQKLSKEIAKELFLEKYNSSTLKKMIEIELSVVQKILKDEIMMFRDLAVKTMPGAKLQLLKQALASADEVVRIIRLRAARDNIDLPSFQPAFFQENSYCLAINSQPNSTEAFKPAF